MLIIPLHRAPTLKNFPWITLALILANIFVFAFLQSGDAHVQQRALENYAQQDLARWEFPAYSTWLAARTDSVNEQRRQFFEHTANAGESEVAASILQSDSTFLADLHAGKVIEPQSHGYADWHARRAEFDQLWDSAFSERWMVHFSHFNLRQMFGAMFMHGGIGHLLGNMLFLALLGLLVEGALGHGLFLAVYLLGGLGSAALSLLWRWGETGSALGASGAIAALMGAYCVLWGTRKVRFFWWFFVVFDYVKAPALVLLPFWLGWELVNLFWNKGAHIGFDAHAAGIACGALLALGVRALHWERRDFLDEDANVEAAGDRQAALATAALHMGRLEIPAARALLDPLAQVRPDDLDVQVALYRCARCEPRRPRLAEAARIVLTLAASGNAELSAQKAVFDDYRKMAGAALPLTPAQTIELVRRWPMIGAGSDAADVLIGLIDRSGSDIGLDAACLALARDLRSRSDAPNAKRLLEQVVAVWPRSDGAHKARVLLADVG